jgi:hypothetical protein
MSALQVPQMAPSGGLSLSNMLTLQQLLTGSPLTLPNGSAGRKLFKENNNNWDNIRHYGLLKHH